MMTDDPKSVVGIPKGPSQHVRQLFVANLPMGLSPDDIERYLASVLRPFGNVTFVRAKLDGNGLPIAFVHFREPVDATAVQEETFMLHGRRLRIEPSRSLGKHVRDVPSESGGGCTVGVCNATSPTVRCATQQIVPAPYQLTGPGSPGSISTSIVNQPSFPSIAAATGILPSNMAAQSYPPTAMHDGRQSTPGYPVLLGGLNLSVLTYRHILIRMSFYGPIIDLHIYHPGDEDSLGLPPQSAIVVYAEQYQAEQACADIVDEIWAGWRVQATVTSTLPPPLQPFILKTAGGGSSGAESNVLGNNASSDGKGDEQPVYMPEPRPY